MLFSKQDLEGQQIIEMRGGASSPNSSMPMLCQVISSLSITWQTRRNGYGWTRIEVLGVESAAELGKLTKMLTKC